MPMDRTQHKEVLNKQGIKWDPLSIHGKDFAVRMRGYSQEEVDDFLDEIIRDYEQMVKIILELSSQPETREESHTEFGNETKKFELQSSQSPFIPAARSINKPVEPVISKDEITMLKVRLANLERKVFGSSRSE